MTDQELLFARDITVQRVALAPPLPKDFGCFACNAWFDTQQELTAHIRTPRHKALAEDYQRRKEEER